MSADPWGALVGQSEAGRRLSAAVSCVVHAYLFVGPDGVGKRQAAFIFAGELLAAADPNGIERHRRLARTEHHPDIVLFTPEGNNLRLGTTNSPGEVPKIIEEGHRSPTEGTRKVLIVEQFQSADPPACSALLKLIEEPPRSTIFVLLASAVPPHQVTIESRCLRVDFAALSHADIARTVISEFSLDDSAAQTIAVSANGSIQRARLLASDPELEHRRNTWWSIPDRLNRSGSMIAEIVTELVDLIDRAEVGVFGDKHTQELEDLKELEAQLGTRGSGRAALESRHKREIRRFRTEELRFGFATLAARYRDLAVADPSAAHAFAAVGHLKNSNEALVRNPRETLLLQALLARLTPPPR